MGALHRLHVVPSAEAPAVTFEKRNVTRVVALRSIHGGLADEERIDAAERTRRAEAFAAFITSHRGARSAIARSWGVHPTRVDRFCASDDVRGVAPLTRERIAAVRPARLRKELDEALFGARQLSLFEEEY